ncbi:MAG TPA: hypothetical protein VN873_16030 [Candidatus Angelobacter sp.]|nr:hypothetical protein [Candidatus Angelobacter sp.]
MKKFASLLLLLLPLSGFGMDRLSALSMLETGNDDYAVGSAGEISRFQVKKAEWKTVTNSANYTDSETARKVMMQLMEKRIHAFQEHFGRQPTDFEFYALWNAPAQVFAGKISHKVAERCQRFANLCARDRKFVQMASVVKSGY